MFRRIDSVVFRTFLQDFGILEDVVVRFDVLKWRTWAGFCCFEGTACASLSLAAGD
jgi:hypothetical protein